MSLIHLNYCSNSSELFNQLRTLPFSCWLDSGKPNSHAGRYDIMVAQPLKRWVKTEETCEEHRYGYDGQLESINTVTEDIFYTLERVQEDIPVSTESLPFTGGIIAYFSYTFGRERLGIQQQSSQECQLPNVIAALYPWAIIQDHKHHQTYLVSLADYPQEPINKLLDHLSHNQPQYTEGFRVGSLTSNTSAENYYRNIAKITDYIHKGDCYQVNFSQCFSSDYYGDPYIAYLKMREVMASPFSTFMDLGHQGAILSLSPERFIKINNNQIVTQPIKGTTSRGITVKTDQYQAQNLQDSQKNQAENVMIVDLLRNDIGKSCVPGSINVPKLFDVESFPNVHHLVSTVTGTIAHGKQPLRIFEDCFPGGSITGAPKKRSMEIIEELEDRQRSVYCGSIMYLSSNGNVDSNIMIRTVACDGKRLFCWGGGGIVADSCAEEEYQESLTKINALLKVLNAFSSER